MLQEDAVRSAQIYLDYLNAHKEEGLGMVRARVTRIQSSLLSGEMAMYTDHVIRSSEGLVLRVGGMVYENTAEEEFYRIFSINRRKLSIMASPELAEAIELAFEKKESIIWETDLTFLIRRVQTWYEKHGEKVELPSVRPICRLDPENPIALSDNQYACAELAMSAPLVYLWGAPGTGKTRHVLASCVLSYIRAGKKVILVAPTNNALEQSLSGLLRALSGEGNINPAGKVIRLGVPGDLFRMIWPEVCEDGALNYLKAELTEQIDQLKYQNDLIRDALAVREGRALTGEEDLFPEKSEQELKRERRNNLLRINELFSRSSKLTESRSIQPLIAEFSVVAATVDTCIHRLSPGGAFKPDHIFLDEAGYCNIIKGMTLLGFGKPLTLLGDHMQLPPVFEGEGDLLRDPEKRLVRLWKISSLFLEDAVSAEDLDQFCRQDPFRPTFSRTQVGALTETYRFGPDLAGILAGKLYGSRFCSRSVNETKILYINAPKAAKDREKDGDGKNSRVSHSEARCVRQLMEANLSHPDLTLGIITPYRKQRRLLAETVDRLLKKYKMEDVDLEDDIVTVHQSQGREWDIVLFSVTDSFDEMFFTNSRKREAAKLINTAVSRARKMLILIGDAGDWMGRPGQLISELFAAGREIGATERLVDFPGGQD